MRAYKVFQNDIQELLSLDPELNLDELTNILPQGVYTTFRTFNQGKKAIDIKYHLERLYGTLEQLHIIPSVQSDVLLIQLRQLLCGIDREEVKIRLILSHSGEPGQVFILIDQLGNMDNVIYDRGVAVVSTKLKRNNPREKSTSFILKSQDIREYLRKNKIYEAVMVDKKDRLLEGITSNFYGVLDNKVWTARNGILLGVTRREILKICRNSGLEIVYKSLRIADILNITEAFMTSSSRGVVPIVKIDNVTVGKGVPGPVAKMLNQKYNELLMSKIDFI